MRKLTGDYLADSQLSALQTAELERMVAEWREARRQAICTTYMPSEKLALLCLADECLTKKYDQWIEGVEC